MTYHHFAPSIYVKDDGEVGAILAYTGEEAPIGKWLTLRQIYAVEVGRWGYHAMDDTVRRFQYMTDDRGRPIRHPAHAIFHALDNASGWYYSQPEMGTILSREDEFGTVASNTRMHPVFIDARPILTAWCDAWINVFDTRINTVVHEPGSKTIGRMGLQESMIDVRDDLVAVKENVQHGSAPKYLLFPGMFRGSQESFYRSNEYPSETIKEMYDDLMDRLNTSFQAAVDAVNNLKE